MEPAKEDEIDQELKDKSLKELAKAIIKKYPIFLFYIRFEGAYKATLGVLLGQLFCALLHQVGKFDAALSLKLVLLVNLVITGMLWIVERSLKRSVQNGISPKKPS